MSCPARIPAVPSFRRGIASVILVLAGMGALACADRTWHAVLFEDTAVGYARFIHENPESSHRALAEEHLAYQKVRKSPSLESYEQFQARYPQSPLSRHLFGLLEAEFFHRARAAGTPDAYREFLEKFPQGQWRARAQGNLVYHEASGFGARGADLALFAARHPESDFAEEARRSAEVMALLSGSRFDQVRLSIQMDSTVDEPEKIRARFTRLARIAYARAGIVLITAGSSDGEVPVHPGQSAELIIRHREQAVKTSIEHGDLERPGMTGLTTVSLIFGDMAEPVFEQQFTLRVDSSEHVTGSSVLFSTAAPRYWNDFFVPVVRSPNRPVLRAVHLLGSRPVDVDAAFDRSVVLYEDGRVQLIELADPNRPLVLADYPRPRDLKHWSGVAILAGEIVIFGEEGVEGVTTGFSNSANARFGRDRIGGVRAIVEWGESWLAAGPGGLHVLDPATGSVERVLKRRILGLDRLDDVLVFTDGESLFVSSLSLLREQRVRDQFRLGRDFGLQRVHSFGRAAVAIGTGGVVVLEIPEDDAPKIVGQLATEEVGEVYDAQFVGDHVFLLGERGLQLFDLASHRIVDSIDVERMSRVTPMGRHLVAVGDGRLQVVDMSVWTQRADPDTPPASAH